MNQNNQTLGQKAKNTKYAENAQAWKTAVAATLGLTLGAGTVYAANELANPDEPVIDPIDIPEEEKEDVQVVEQPKATEQTVIHNHYHGTSAGGASSNAHAETHDAAHASLPGYTIFEHEVYTQDNGSQMDVAFGITDNDHLCVIYDTDMDGLANTFFEDRNDSGLFTPDEGIDLADNGITLSMDHLPNDYSGIDMTPATEDIAIVVPVDSAVILEGHEVVDADTAADSTLPDYTNDADLAQTDDAGDISGINEYMA